jgi:hypothetical protein
MNKLLPAFVLFFSLVLANVVSAQSGSRGYVPAHRNQTGTRFVQEPVPTPAIDVEQLGPGIPLQGEPELLEFWDGDVHVEGGVDGGCSSCGSSSCGSSSCGTGSCGGGCLIPCPWFSLDNIELFGGVNGFTGPNNRGETGSFGFYEGLNWGAPLPCLGFGELGAQIGARAVQANLSGAEFTTNQRDQLFLTAGIFRRVDWGFQGGAVVDYMHEDWYAEVDLVQVRAELSWLYPERHEIGAFITTATQSDVAVSMVRGAQVTETFESTDLYAFFYRNRCDTGDWRVFAGLSGKSDGLLGTDFQWALNDCWAMEGGFTYLIPEEGVNNRGHQEEAWNIALGLVWYPGRRSATGTDYYRPLFDVASNGAFLVDRR